MENLRLNVIGEDGRKFRTGLFGYKKIEIEEYIDALEQGMRASVSNYEKKLGEQSVSLNMALREKETLEEKARELEKQLKALSGGSDDEKSLLIAQNNALREENAELCDQRNKNEILASEAAGLRAEIGVVKSEQESLSELLKEKDAVILEQCKKNAETEKNLRTEMEKQKLNQESERKIQLCGIDKIKERLKTALETLESL